jgi:hypothetical protein
VDSKARKIAKRKETLQNDKMINQQGIHRNSKWVNTGQQNIKIYEAKADRAKTRNIVLHNYNWYFNISLSN